MVSRYVEITLRALVHPRNPDDLEGRVALLVGGVQADPGGLPYAFRWAFVVFMIIFHEFMIMNSPRPCRLNGVQRM